MLAPFLVVIETVNYLIRAISLGVRLAANISAGHLLFAILSGFAFNMLSSGMIILSFLPMLIMIFIALLEIMVAVIQAYVFCLLTAIYLGTLYHYTKWGDTRSSIRGSIYLLIKRL